MMLRWGILHTSGSTSLMLCCISVSVINEKEGMKSIRKHLSGSLESLDAAKLGSWWSAEQQQHVFRWMRGVKAAVLLTQNSCRKVFLLSASCKHPVKSVCVCEATVVRSISELLDRFWCQWWGNDGLCGRKAAQFKVFGSNRKWSIHLWNPQIISTFVVTFRTNTVKVYREVPLDKRQQLCFA